MLQADESVLRSRRNLNVHTKMRPEWYLFRTGRKGKRRKGEDFDKEHQCIGFGAPMGCPIVTGEKGMELRRDFSKTRELGGATQTAVAENRNEGLAGR